ncbi:MAG: hypothetical protein ACFCUL_02965 [Flavobacteriaceae bacterium]
MKHSFFLFFVLLIIQAGLSNPLEASFCAQNTSKSSIKITSPNESTVWTIGTTVDISWDTQNIPSDKTIQFYLSKDDMVIQELGIFRNNKYIDGIQLNRSIPSGTNYRVFGIELFPDDKTSIAKYATALFTIKKAPRETVSTSITDESQTITLKNHEEKPTVRDFFDGRNIKYVNELEVYSDQITISLWDHGRVDGDIVSIYLNGEAIVSKYTLTYRKKTFKLQLDASKPNDLFLYAHNLGKSPPNTVSIEIKDGAVSEQIILNSDLKSCEAVLIKVAK